MLELDIVTPERRVLAEKVHEVVLPAAEGYMGVRPGHAPLMTTLQVGELSYRDDKGAHVLAVSGGYAEVLRDSVTVLATTAERPDEIDVERAKQARERAEERLKSHAEGIDVARAQVALARALNRLSAQARSRV
jgi:F-type H+-transporting ATPase subunit epsilon